MLKEMPIKQKSNGPIASRVCFTILIKIQVFLQIWSKIFLGDEDAANKFSQIARAYEVLSDETKR
jgi:hypothetical protein